jgi:D-alanyl-D-alanine dipeptidase
MRGGRETGLALLALFVSVAARAGMTPFPSAAELSGYVEVSTGAGIAVDLKYSGVDNFTGEDLYGDFNDCYLRPEAAEMIRRAAAFLQDERPGWSLVLYDCLRPLSVQRRLWAKVKGTAREPFVADPKKKSMHNYGLAVDLSLLDEEGRPVDMGTPYDYFSYRSETLREGSLVRRGKLTPGQVENRRLLRKVMRQAGFLRVPFEWWHFNAMTRRRAQRLYRPLK